MDREQEVIYEQCRTKALEYANSPEAATSHYDFPEAYDAELIRLVRKAALEEAAKMLDELAHQVSGRERFVLDLCAGLVMDPTIDRVRHLAKMIGLEPKS